MDPGLVQLYDSLVGAMCPEDVFGALEPADGGSRDEALDASFRRLARACHPDRFHGSSDPDERDVAGEAFRRLTAFRARAEVKLAAGTWGQRDAPDLPADEETMEVKTARKTYRVATRPFVEGDVGLLYRGTCLEGEGPDSRVVLKLAREVEDNDLVRNEARVLGRLKGTPSAQSKHLPVLLDQFRSGDRNGVVLREIDAFDGTTLREKLPSGVPAEHAAWILARLLSVLGFAHSKGIVHGNVEPAHVMVHPPDHNVFVIDWTAAVVEPARTGEGFRTLNELYSPPEVSERKPPLPASDLYSAGKTMIHLLGGDPRTGELPASVPGRLGRILSFMTLPGPRQRAQDAWEIYREVGLAREELYGPHRFVEFRV